MFCVLAGALLANAESCSTAGQVQYKYTASGCSYTTQTRTCCATTGAWSDWDTACPTTKTCDQSQKPATSQDCNDCTYKSRTVTCNTSTGIWETGAWGSCQTKQLTCEWGGVEGGVFAMTESEIAAEFGDYVWISDSRGSCSCEQKNKTGLINRGTQNGYIMVTGPVYCYCS